MTNEPQNHIISEYIMNFFVVDFCKRCSDGVLSPNVELAQLSRKTHRFVLKYEKTF